MDGDFQKVKSRLPILDQPSVNLDPVKHRPRKNEPNISRRKLVITLITIISMFLVLGGVYGAVKYSQRHRSPVPSAIAKSVNFPVYYPDPAKLPKGYVLDLISFTNPEKNTAFYIVRYGDNQKIQFSLQAKPSDDDIESFYANFIPLRNKLEVAAGNAEIGAFNNGGKGPLQTVISLPTSANTWILITAPSDIDQTDLKTLLLSLRR